MKKRYMIGILAGCLTLLSVCAGCAINSNLPEVMVESDIEYIIPAGTPFTAQYEGVLKERIANRDLVVMDLGRKLKLEQEANSL
jgi:hypothetical protein